MDSDLLFNLFDQMEQSYLGEFMRDSIWLFPVVEAFHLIGLAILGGSILVADLRLMGFALSTRPIHYVLNQSMKLTKTGLFVLILTGVPLFLSEAIKCYYSRAFWIKMSALVLGLIFLFLIRNPFSLKLKESSINLKFIGFLSIAIWAVVAGSGRWIGFS